MHPMPMKTPLKILNLLIVLLFAPIANSIVIVPKPPEIKVESYVLYNPNTGTIIASEEETNQIKPASITKLMTAYTVFHAIKEEQIAMDDPVSKRLCNVCRWINNVPESIYGCNR